MKPTALFAALLLISTPAAAQQQGSWTRAWAASPLAAPREQVVTVEDATLRAAMRVGAGGSALRLRLSNEHGEAKVRIAAATIKTADGRIARVTFGGRPAGEIAIGAPLVSDRVALAVKPFEVVEVSLYLRDRTALTTVHAAGGAPTAVSPPGDHSAAPGFTAARTTNWRPLIAGIDVLTPKRRPVVVAYGDSITDNTGCANDAPVVCRWGDVLGRRLAKAGRPHVVITQAISGNKILTPGTGPSALARFDRDVLSVPGVSHIAILEGINDIGASGGPVDGVPTPPLTSQQLIDAYRQMIVRAHDHGIKVIGLTILPFEGGSRFTPEREAIRVAVNEWIRTSGEFDGVFDLEKVVADPANPRKLAAGLQVGDNLHPNALGEFTMGEAIPLSLFR